ncbi:glycosyltransferase family 2 protein [Anaerocolumna chitinilytica]|uniref:Beta-glycosyltransferase n=1 Tax=Anaerocolumna chitinilytica TaxID=1727145 RepID=A0A7I8DR08_9FIRM|nr:glycosyltransferase family 2 protein [Anaerocolumna chitinilytica]BCK00820.1 beta-glycosyltransferase [Anaerocolumna chitinilytica]
MTPYITVFTPTYNRFNLLHYCYNSLKRQTIKNFEWLIIDDGSTDNTKELVEKWMNEEKDFHINYRYKNNGGLHTAYNMAIENMNTELCICIDSDDFLPDNAIEIILKLWEEKKDNQYAGIIGLDYDINDNIIGDKLPEVNSINLNYMLVNKIGCGDKKIVMRTELYKKVAPMKTFNNEKNFNPNYLNTLISEDYDFLVLNKNLCYVEYQQDGMSSNIYKQYINSPNSFAELRRLYMTIHHADIKFILKNAIHYDSSCIISKNYNDILSKSPRKLLTLLVFPIGIILSIYIKYKYKKVIKQKHGGKN